MDWPTLLLLVPLVIIPIVFLGGFTGCCFSAPQDCPTPSNPSDLVATVINGRIRLSWNDNGTKTDHFKIIRTEDGGPPLEVSQLAIAGTPPIPNNYSDPLPLKEATYEYQVFGIVLPAILEDSCSGDTLTCLGGESGSDPAQVTVAYKPVFEAAFNENQNNWANDCLVQRISAANLLASGRQVKITLRSSENAALSIKSAYISQWQGPPGEDWDSHTDLTQVKFGGNAGVELPLGGSVRSDETLYAIDDDKDLIIAFDIGIQGGARRGPKTGCQAYRGQTTEQAATADRSNFTLQGTPANTVYLVEKIEVLSQV